MNCEKAERWLLLEHSGELSPARQKKLAQHLLICQRCRVFSSTLEPLLTAAESALAPGKGLASETVANIRARATAWRAATPARSYRNIFQAMVGAGAAAALIAVMANRGWRTTQRQLNRIGEMRALAAFACTEEVPEAVAPPFGDRSAELRALAQILLRVEEMSDNWPEEDDLAEQLTSTPAPPPTALQSRSSDGPSARKCV